MQSVTILSVVTTDPHTGFPGRLVLQALGRPRQFDRVAASRTESTSKRPHYFASRVASRCQAAKASISFTAEGPNVPRLISTETLLRLLLPLNDQV